MLYMNEYEVNEARARFQDHPILGPATQTLSNLVDTANRNSDGWAYWPKPARAAKGLMTVIQSAGRWGENADDVTAAQVRKAYGPIRALLTRTGLTMDFAEVK